MEYLFTLVLIPLYPSFLFQTEHCAQIQLGSLLVLFCQYLLNILFIPRLTPCSFMAVRFFLPEMHHWKRQQHPSKLICELSTQYVGLDGQYDDSKFIERRDSAKLDSVWDELAIIGFETSLRHFFTDDNSHIGFTAFWHKLSKVGCQRVCSSHAYHYTSHRLLPFGHCNPLYDIIVKNMQLWPHQTQSQNIFRYSRSSDAF